jgi:adenylosuccinate lyase
MYTNVIHITIALIHIIFVVLGIEVRASHMLSKHSTTEPFLQSPIVMKSLRNNYHYLNYIKLLQM